MSEEKELDEQGNPIEDNHSDDDEGKEDTPKTVKVGDKELTLDQIAELEKKASGYDALLPEFTKKSQKLSEFEQAQKPKEEDLPSYKQKDWEPKTMAELAKAIEEAEERGMNRALGTLEQRQAEQTKVKQEVDDFVTKIKNLDKEFDEQDFFSYASKHKFPVKTVEDLSAVYSSYSELQKIAEAGGKPKGRRDKVNIPGSGGEGNPNFTDIRTQGGSILDTALSAFERLKSNK